jgi:hypothetical protein
MELFSDYLFSFNNFIEELRNDEDKREIIEKYEEAFGSLKGKNYTDCSFYKDYVSQFDVDEDLMKRIEVPDELKYCFDYELLLRLVAASFSSEYKIEHLDETDTERLKIAVNSKGQSIVKSLDELWSFQILRLFEIYFEEQMNLENLTKNSTNEKDAITFERNMRLKTFDRVMVHLKEDRSGMHKRQEKRRELDAINEMA